MLEESIYPRNGGHVAERNDLQPTGVMVDDGEQVKSKINHQRTLAGDQVHMNVPAVSGGSICDRIW